MSSPTTRPFGFFMYRFLSMVVLGQKAGPGSDECLTSRHPGPSGSWPDSPRGFIRQDSVSSQTGNYPTAPVESLPARLLMACFLSHQSARLSRPRLPSNSSSSRTSYPQLIPMPAALLARRLRSSLWCQKQVGIPDRGR